MSQLILYSVVGNTFPYPQGLVIRAFGALGCTDGVAVFLDGHYRVGGCAAFRDVLYKGYGRFGGVGEAVGGGAWADCTGSYLMIRNHLE